MNIPIIKLELNGMKQAIQTALANRHREIEEIVADMLNNIATEEHIRHLIKEHINSHLSATVNHFMNERITGLCNVLIDEAITSDDINALILQAVTEKLKNGCFSDVKALCESGV